MKEAEIMGKVCSAHRTARHKYTITAAELHVAKI
jgi:hypothetical protein